MAFSQELNIGKGSMGLDFHPIKKREFYFEYQRPTQAFDIPFQNDENVIDIEEKMLGKITRRKEKIKSGWIFELPRQLTNLKSTKQ